MHARVPNWDETEVSPITSIASRRQAGVEQDLQCAVSKRERDAKWEGNSLEGVAGAERYVKG